MYLVVVFVTLSKSSMKDFQVTTDHSAFITSQSVYVPVNTVPKHKYFVEQLPNIIRTATRTVFIDTCAYTDKIYADNQLHICL